MSSLVNPRQPLIDLENKKFRQGVDGNDIGVKVFSEGSHPLDAVDWDSYGVVRNSLTDVVTYYQGGLTGTVVLIFTATFSSPRKKASEFVSGVWSTP